MNVKQCLIPRDVDCPRKHDRLIVGSEVSQRQTLSKTTQPSHEG